MTDKVERLERRLIMQSRKLRDILRQLETLEEQVISTSLELARLARQSASQRTPPARRGREERNDPTDTHCSRL